MKITEHWLLFKYIEGQFTPLSKPFKTKAAAEKGKRPVTDVWTKCGCVKKMVLCGHIGKCPLGE